MLDFDRVLKMIAVIGALIVGYLWAGGIWEYKGDDQLERVHKITGEVNVLEFDSQHRVYFWRNAMKHVPKTKKELEEEFIEQNPATTVN